MAGPGILFDYVVPDGNQQETFACHYRHPSMAGGHCIPVALGFPV